MFNDNNFLTFNKNNTIAVQSGEKMILLKKKSFKYKNINYSKKSKRNVL